MFQKFPYTDNHQLNLDWLLNYVKNITKGDPGDPGVLEFDSAVNMMGARDIQADMIAHTLGFHLSGDSGEAWYYITDNETANGMDILALQNGLFAVYVPTEIINVVQFGADNAIGNMTDSTANIQRCINYVAARIGNTPLIADWNQSGGVVAVPAGEYNVTHLNIPEGVTIKGETPDSSVIVGDNTDPQGVMGQFTINSTARRIGIYDITVNKGAIFLQGAYKSEVNNINIYNSPGVAALMLDKTVDTKLENIHIYGAAGSGIYILATTLNDTTLFTDNLWIAHCREGITIDTVAFANGLIFRNTIIEYCRTVGRTRSRQATTSDRDDSGVVFDGLYLEGNTYPYHVTNKSITFRDVISVSEENDFANQDIVLDREITHDYTPVVVLSNVEAHVVIAQTSTAKVLVNNVKVLEDNRNNPALVNYISDTTEALIPFMSGTVQSFSIDGVDFSNCTRKMGGYIKIGKMCYVKIRITASVDTAQALTGLPAYSSFTGGTESALMVLDCTNNTPLAGFVNPAGTLNIYPSMVTGTDYIITGWYFPLV